MIAVDTNVLVRLMVNDDAAQASRARRLFDELANQGEHAWVTDTVLVELVWTLARAYGRDREEQALTIHALVDHGTVQLESVDAIRQALVLFEQTSADFADCLLASKAQLAGCDKVATFDRGIKKLPLVHLL